MDNLYTFFTNYFVIFLVILFLISLCIGSFLNVVIYRLPIILRQAWHQQCAELLHLSPPQEKKALSLALPRSHCPTCKTKLKFWQNIPLLSFIILKGKCAHCGAAISWRYPLVELITAFVSIMIAIYFGVTWKMVAGLVFSWILIALIFIDIAELMLPDLLTLGLLWVGLYCNYYELFVPLSSAVMGAIAGYISLWIIGSVFKWIRGIEGIGYGDYKLFAALGAWFGWEMLIFMILIASVLGMVMGIVFLLMKKTKRETPIPFAPYLAIAGWICLLGNQELIHYYHLWLWG